MSGAASSELTSCGASVDSGSDLTVSGGSFESIGVAVSGGSGSSRGIDMGIGEIIVSGGSVVGRVVEPQNSSTLGYQGSIGVYANGITVSGDGSVTGQGGTSVPPTEDMLKAEADYETNKTKEELTLAFNYIKNHEGDDALASVLSEYASYLGLPADQEYTQDQIIAYVVESTLETYKIGELAICRDGSYGILTRELSVIDNGSVAGSGGNADGSYSVGVAVGSYSATSGGLTRTVSVSGGTITGTGGAGAHSVGLCINYTETSSGDDNKLAIKSGGSVTATGGAGSTSSLGFQGTFALSDGKLTANSEGSENSMLLQGANTVTGGSLVGRYKLDTDASLLVSGGHFSHQVAKEHLDNSLTAELYSSGRPDDPFSYTTLEQALSAAQPGDKVTAIGSNVSDTFTVTIKYGNGDSDTVYTLPGDTTFALPSAPQRTGYTFAGWYDENNNRVVSPYTVTKDTTLSARWDAPYTGTYNHAVTVSADLENGSVSIDAADRYATDGEKITVTVTPDAGYMVDEVIITDASGNKIEVTDNGDGTYTFTMPSSGVSIDATFVEDPNYEEPTDDPDAPSTIVDVFTDVDATAWYFGPVQYVIEHGLMTGTSATTFEPNTPTTRGMIVSILHRLENSPAVSGSDFTDVADSDWYGQAVAWASSNNIVGGYGDGTFRPNQVITREEMASILYRYCEYKGVDINARADLSNYTDSPSDWAYEVMQWANAEGLITGRTATTIDAQDETTRAECAAIFQRYIENIVE